MADYKKMYLTLVNETTNTIDSLTEALKRAEHIYIETSEDAGETDTNDEHSKTLPN